MAIHYTAYQHIVDLPSMRSHMFESSDQANVRIVRYAIEREGSDPAPFPGITTIVDRRHNTLTLISDWDEETTDEFVFAWVQAGWVLSEMARY